jgi:ribonuclease HI
MIKIYTDGAYSPSRNVGGWAFVITEKDEKIFSNLDTVKDTTNNRMEILACFKALEWLKENNKKEAIIISDSMYVIGTMTKNWKKNKNVDLWVKMFNIIGQFEITWQHVKGHSGDKWNEYCDMLAVHASHIVCNNYNI